MMKTVLVTGGNRGIGLEICRQLDALGHTVIMGSRDLQKGEMAAQHFRKKVIVKQLDVTKEESIRDLFTFVNTGFGKLDVLVNNAGIGANHKGKEHAVLAKVKDFIANDLPGAGQVVQLIKPFLQKAGLKPRVEGAASISLAGVRDLMETNFYGPWRMIQVFLPLLQNSEGGRVINMSSGMGELNSLSGIYPGYSL